MEKFNNKKTQITQELEEIEKQKISLQEEERLVTLQLPAHQPDLSESISYSQTLPSSSRTDPITCHKVKLRLLRANELDEQVRQRKATIEAAKEQIFHLDEELRRQNNEFDRAKIEISKSEFEIISRIAIKGQPDLNRMISGLTPATQHTRSGSLVTTPAETDQSEELNMSYAQPERKPHKVSNMSSRVSTSQELSPFKPLIAARGPNLSSNRQYLLAKHGLQSIQHSPKHSYVKKRKMKDSLQLKFLESDKEHLDLLNFQKDLQAFRFLKPEHHPDLRRLGSAVHHGK